MLRKIHTSCNKRRFLHEQSQNNEPHSNNITRPPTSHPYGPLRNIRSHETLHNKNNYVNKSFNQKEGEDKDPKINQICFEFKSKSWTIPKIKILFRARQKHEAKLIETLIQNLARKIGQLFHENQQNKKQIYQMEEQNMKLKDQNEQLIKKLRKIENNNSYESKGISKNQTKVNEYDLVIQNVKLAQLNAAYLNKIKDLEDNKKEKHVEIKKEVHQNQNTQILRFHNRISYLQMKLKNAEDREVQLNDDVQRLEKQKNILKEKIYQIEEQKIILCEKLNQWREKAMMQFQDSEMHMSRQNFLLFSIKKLRELNKGLTEKLIHQGNSEGNLLKNEIEPNPYFQYEIDFFKSIKNVYFDAKLKDFKMSLHSKKQQNLELTNFQLEEQYLQYRKYEEINLTLFTYFMPSFYSFIQESITNQISNTRLKNNGSVSRVFIQILRAILNSKLNEFLMFSQEKYTRFPQFVYTWFQKFYFNSEKNQVAVLQPYMQKPFPQDIFYRDLMNIKLDQSWQIITFRQFLLEELNLEQLYFFLMCQNLLFRKASISKLKQYQGDFCILVQYNAAKSVLDMVLSDFESWNLSYLTSKMRQKIVYKKNVQYIESGFFLRCLVEYYKIQRINRYKYINKLCDEFKSQERGLRFSSFISVINRFSEVGVQQKIRLYRQCFCLGKGKITSDIIFTVCSQKLIFLRYLKLKCFYKLPLLTSQRSIRNVQSSLMKNTATNLKIQKKSIICVQPSDPYLYHIYIKMLAFMKHQSVFQGQIQRLGLIDVINHFSHMQKVFNQKLSTTDSSILRCRHFMHFLNETISRIKIINYSNLYQLLQEENKKKNNQSFWIQIKEADLCQIMAEQFTATVKIYEKLSKYIEWKNKVVDFRLQHAARKIQRMVRKKFIAPFIELYKIIYSQFKSGEQPPK